MRIKINRVSDSKKKFALDIESYYTGLTIKKKIRYFYDFSCDEYILTCKSARFQDDNIPSDFDIKDGNTMNLIDLKQATPESSPISYITLTGEAGTV